MLYSEIIAVCSQIHTKHINTLRGQKVELLNVKLVVHIVTAGLYRVMSVLTVPSYLRLGQAVQPQYSCIHPPHALLRPKKRTYHQHVVISPPPQSIFSVVQINLFSVYFGCLLSNELTCPQHSNHIFPPAEINNVLTPELRKFLTFRKNSLLFSQRTILQFLPSGLCSEGTGYIFF